ncbi:MAG: WecB/TagA/CpsF family glycosyltransferase [Ignavibacteriae bacterium]|nr:WecB/TagA/CpsF family glycosyltransferase [Ignavibacteriota bacterium]
MFSKINIFNENDYKESIESAIKGSQLKILFYLNSHVVYETNKNPEVKKYIISADYLIADGYSIVWAYQNLLNKKIKKVVFTYSYFKFIRKLFIKNNSKIFFLGASKQNIEKATKLEMNNFPNLKLVGYHHGYFDTNFESAKIIKSINKSNAEVLIVGMGCPLAEKWIIKNKGKLNPSLIFSVGGFFDFLAKDKISAPKWMYNSGFEWLFRLTQEPKRLFRRYLTSNLYFLFIFLKAMLNNDKKQY